MKVEVEVEMDVEVEGDMEVELEGYGSYLRPKTHIQYTHSQHLSTRTHAYTNNTRTHRNMMG